MTNHSKDKLLTEENFFEVAGNSMQEAKLSEHKVRNMKERVMNRITTSEPAGGQTVRQNKRIWHDIAPGISINIIAQDLKQKTQTAIWKIKAGAVIPEHYHHNREECLVLKGIVAVGEHIINEGDIHIMEAGSHHEPLRAVTDAELYLRHDIYEDISWLSAH